MDKLTEMISLRVPPIVKTEWEALSDEQKKHCKRMVMDTITQDRRRDGRDHHHHAGRV